jgi:hypothetical protein
MSKYFVMAALLLLCLNAFSQTAIPPAEGDGTETNPYQIASLENLYWLAQFQEDNITDNLFFIQTADIDASETVNWLDGQGWNPIGENYDFPIPINYNGIIPRSERGGPFSFKGHYDGQGHKIDSLYINRPDGWGVGLFACISHGYPHGGSIRNLGLTNVTVIGYEHVGGIAGQAQGALIENCFVEGDISGIAYVGGVAGFSCGVDVIRSYTKGSVTGFVWVGGFLGYVSWSATHSLYTHAEVTGSGYVGGIAGLAWSTYIDFSYSTGAITSPPGQHGGPIVGYIAEWGTTQECYYNTETTGFTSRYGIGRTTAEMTYPYADNTYINDITGEPWDFENIWVEDIYMFHNDGYPYFSWQTFHFEFIPPASLSAIAGDEIVNLYWNEPPDSLRTVLGYNVYRDDLQITPEIIIDTEYEDIDVINDVTYSYHVTAVYDDGESGPSNVVRATPSVSSYEEETVSLITDLKGNYPNPFNPETNIEFSLIKPSQVRISVYNAKGQRVRLLTDRYYEQGVHNVIWDGKTDNGTTTGSGMYFYRMESGDYVSTKKMILLK